MSVKTFFARLLRRLLKIVLLSTIFLGSCTGLGIAYHKSADFMINDIDHETAATKGQFFVAFTVEDKEGNQSIKAWPYRVVRERPDSGMIGFRLPDGKHFLDVPAGEGSASVESTTDDAGTQTVRVRIVGDTPWSSVSVYQVRDNKIIPMKLGLSSFWILLAAAFVPLVLVFVLQKWATRIALWIIPGQTKPAAAAPPHGPSDISP